MTIGEYIQQRRIECGLTAKGLAELAGISHTEVHRIERNERKKVSLNTLIAMSEVFNVPREEILKLGGYLPDDETSAFEKAFPKLKSEKQREPVEHLINGLTRSKDLSDADYDDLKKQIDMFFDAHAFKKNHSKRAQG